MQANVFQWKLMGHFFPFNFLKAPSTFFSISPEKRRSGGTNRSQRRKKKKKENFFVVAQVAFSIPIGWQNDSKSFPDLRHTSLPKSKI